ncbi:hypothetical protein [uncultured Brevundimonas sp.]|uniref:hypothetical protein n=1 Tax=uncultured Brevundimonas sp. TaxID=213418 RepID=UPI00261837A8|nr:hypothetical protein [uncultured Brevundimonas sp.]
MKPLRPGDVVRPHILYRYIPFGVLSMACHGLFVLTVLLLGVALIRAPREVLSSFHGEGLMLWLGFGLAWLALPAANLAIGTKLARRRMVIGMDEVIIRSSSGTERSTSLRNVSEATISHSTAAIHSLLRLKYHDGKRTTVNTAGFDSRDVQRLAEMIESISIRQTF